MIHIVDASAVVAALVDDSPVGRWCEERVEEAPLAAPHLMPFEVGNIIRRMAARAALDDTTALAALDDLDRLDIELVPFAALGERTWELRGNLTVYDASYVALAELFDGRLITLDRRLGRAPGLRCEVAVAP